MGYTDEADRDVRELLMPQIQRTYCILGWSSMRKVCRRTVFKQMRSVSAFERQYSLKVNHAFDMVVAKIQEYHGQEAWLCPSYVKVCKELFSQRMLQVPVSKIRTKDSVLERYSTSTGFQMCSVELYDGNDEMVAGELGYIIGSVFTSLTGFCKREKKLAIGKIQIVSLALLLEKYGFEFLNLGCPPLKIFPGMRYKAEIGGIEISRDEFLKRWDPATENFNSIDYAGFCSSITRISDLL